MKKYFRRIVPFGFALLFLALGTFAQTPGALPANGESAAQPAKLELCAACIRAHMEFLASDALRGRGSATPDELVAATYVASQLRAYGIEPAGDDGGYIQRVPLVQRKLTGPPRLKFTIPGEGDSTRTITWTYGKEFRAISLTQTHFTAPLRKVNADSDKNKAVAGAIALISGSDQHKIRKAAFLAATAAAAGVIVPARDQGPAYFKKKTRELPTLPGRPEGQGSRHGFNVLEVNALAAKVLAGLAEGTMLHFDAPSTTEAGSSWNAIAELRGSDDTLKYGAIVLSAHLDHLGVGEPVNGDNIYNGADDDASGTAAVLELARVLGAGPRPQRTVIFALFGSEETGGVGSTYFRDHPPLPLPEIAADLEFEMIGRPDPSVEGDTLWLTGWERSDLGPTLAAHGTKLVADPRPEQNFFARSDNYTLAKKGVVAHTISSYGLHSDYHQPRDDVAHIDFKHLEAAIQSLLESLQWLANSDFIPRWKPGAQP